MSTQDRGLLAIHHLLQLPDVDTLKIPDSEREAYRTYSSTEPHHERQMRLGALHRLELPEVKAATLSDTTVAVWYIYFPDARLIKPETPLPAIGMPDKLTEQLPRYVLYFDYCSLLWFSNSKAVHAVVIGSDKFGAFPRVHLTEFTRGVEQRPTSTKMMEEIAGARGFFHTRKRKSFLAAHPEMEPLAETT